jgi:hypothetical protein
MRVCDGDISRIFCILSLSPKKIRLDFKKFSVIFGPFARRHSLAYSAEVTRLGVIAYGAEVCAALVQLGRRVADVAPSSAPRSIAPSSDV